MYLKRLRPISVYFKTLKLDIIYIYRYNHLNIIFSFSSSLKMSFQNLLTALS